MVELLEQEEVVVEQKKYKQLFACYGTLRLNQGNWRWCLKGRSDYLGTINTEPIFNMYSLGGYPAVAENGSTAIVVDVFGTDDDDCIEDVNSLESYYGKGNPHNYYDVTTIQTEWGETNMFIMNRCNDNPNLATIKTGDWLIR